MQMMKTRLEGVQINPPAMTRVDYDKTRGYVFGTKVTEPSPRYPNDPTTYFPKLSGRGGSPSEIYRNPDDLPPGGFTHELEHHLAYTLGQGGLPKPVMPGLGLMLAVEKGLAQKILQGVNPSKSPIFPEWEGWDLAKEYVRNPNELARAAIRLHNRGSPKHKQILSALFPDFAEKLSLVPEEVLSLLVPYNQAGGVL